MLPTVGLIVFFGFALLTLYIPVVDTATPPAIITYQGKLAQNNANVTTTQAMGFLIYDDSTGGNLLYTASGTLVATSTIDVAFSSSSAGNFSVQLGGTGTNSVTSTIFAENDALYLEVWVEGTKLSPRRRLTSVPFALNSQYLMGFAATTTATSTYIPLSDSNGNFLFTGVPQSTTPGGAVLYINPDSADPDETLFGIALNGSERFVVDEDGDTSVNGHLTVSSTLFVSSSLGFVGINSSSPNYNLSVSGTSYFSATTTIADLLHVKGRTLNPTIVGNFSTIGTIYEAQVVGDYAYITDYSDGKFYIVDISDPSNPTQIGSVANNPGNVFRSLDVQGNYAYVGAEGYFLVIDISRPTTPTIISSLDLGIWGVTSIEVRANYAYVAANTDFFIIDINKPSEPRVISTFDPGGASYSTVDGDYAYIAENAFGSVRVLNISDPVNPFQVANVDTTGFPSFVKISGKYLYVSDTTGDELLIYNISDPTNPLILSTTDFGGGFSTGMEISGNYLYLAYDSGGVHIVDITNKSNPTLVKTITFSLGNAHRVTSVGNYLYVSTESGGLNIVDISGAQIMQANIGTLETSNLHVRSRSFFDGSLHVKNGVSIGTGGLQLNGGFSMMTATSTSNTTNTLSFSHTALFETNVTSTYNYAFLFNTKNTLSIDASTYLLSVRNNNTPVFSVSTNGDVNTTGTYYGAAVAVSTPGAPGDLAETVDIAIDDSPEPGDVMIVDPNSTDTYRRSGMAYERAVAGVISTDPTITIGNGRTDHTAVLAMIGRLPVKASTENGPILRGDILVTASKLGFAMKYDPTKDDGIKIVGVIGIALDPLVAGEGKIMALVKSGWMNNRHDTIAEMQQDLIEIAEASGVNISTSPTDLQVTENAEGNLGMISENLNLNGYYIVNVAGLTSKNNDWQIDEQGRFITRVKTSEGNKSLYALQSENTEYVFSGTGQLKGGEAIITFSTSTRDILDPEATQKVSVTLTSEANGIFIAKKDASGFVVKELLDGKSEATFDWVVIARRRLSETSGVMAEPVLSLEPTIENAPVQEPSPSEEIVPVEETPGEVTSSTEESVAPLEVLPEEIPVVVEPVVIEEPVIPPVGQPEPVVASEPVPVPAESTPVVVSGTPVVE